MASTGDIVAMGYIAIRTPDLAESVRSSTDIFGLEAVDVSNTKAYLSASRTHHELVFINDDASSLDHIGLVAADQNALAAIREKVAAGGWKIVSETPLEDHIDTGFSFVGPEGYTWHVYLGMSIYDNRAGGFGPDRYGHATFWVQDSIAMRDFVINTFGFVVSDQIGEDTAFFLRCNSEHHGIGIMKSPVPGLSGLHHHAWQTQSITDLGRLGDRLASAGDRLLWGPVRHGAGHNIAAYYREPSGGTVELYTDMEHIWDRNRGIVYWAEGDLRWINQWDGHISTDSRATLTTPYQRS
ncbi:VOC family protein [Mycolicibacterium sp. CBM1]